ncbi:MAG TPA: general secretion pathway protein GspK [Proteobacteria bacterium]|nr:general secretion pathway protein GspK [Pseudomonadota bacterium]
MTPNDGKRRGIALIIVLLVVALLSVIVLEFAGQVQLQRMLASNLADSVRAFYLAKSGIYIAARSLIDDLNSSREDHLGEMWAFPLPPIPLEGGVIKVTISDETAKINLNRLVLGSNRVNTRIQGATTQLFTLLNLDPALVDAIIDWIDEDTSQLTSGADENAAYGYGYGAADYLSKNARLDTLEELRLIAGFNNEVFNKVKPFVSIYGTNRININTADPVVIQAIINSIHPNPDQTLGEQMAEYRLTQPFSGARWRRQLINDLGMDKPLASRLASSCTTRSRYFRIRVEAKTENSVVYAEAVIRRSKKGARFLWWKIR